MPIRVFDKFDELHHFNIWEVCSIYKEDRTRRHIALIGANEYYFPHTIEHRTKIMEPLGFYQINESELINMALIDNYEKGVITIRERGYRPSVRKRPGFESVYLPN